MPRSGAGMVPDPCAPPAVVRSVLLDLLISARLSSPGAETGQTLMTAPIAAVAAVVGASGWTVRAIDHPFHLFGS